MTSVTSRRSKVMHTVLNVFGMLLSQSHGMAEIDAAGKGSLCLYEGVSRQ